MNVLHHMVMFSGCVATGLAHSIPWKIAFFPLALVVAGVFMGARRVKKGK
jgi:hypothetical protein